VLNRTHFFTFLSAAQQLSSAVESQDLGTWPLPDGAAKGANRHSTRLPHGFKRSSGVPEPDGPASGDGSTGGGGGMARDGVSEVGGMVAVHGTNGPWGRPHGLMEMCVVRHIRSAPMGLVTIVMQRSLPSCYPSSFP
jgi:hypothetical protein